jgi:hypothetical protein
VIAVDTSGLRLDLYVNLSGEGPATVRPGASGVTAAPGVTAIVSGDSAVSPVAGLVIQ